MTLGKRLLEYRLAAGFNSTNAVATACGIAQSAVWRLENNEDADPRLSTLEKLADTYGVPLYKLFTEEKDRPEDLSWFWTARFSALISSEIDDLRSSARKRMVWATSQLLDAFGAGRVSELLDYPADDLRAVSVGTADPDSELETALAKCTRLSLNFLRLGEVPPPNDLLRALLMSQYAGAWLAFVNRAQDNGVLPDVMERQLDVLLMVKRNNNPPVD